MKSIPELLREIIEWQDWKKNRRDTLADVLHVTVADIDNWMEEKAIPTKAQTKCILNQHREAQKTRITALIRKLEQLRYKHHEIASGIGLKASASITHARMQDFCLSEEHFDKLQCFYEMARATALRTFIEILPDFKFGCALPGKQSLSDYKHTAETLHKQTKHSPVTEGCSLPGLQGIVFLWRLPFPDDSKAFYLDAHLKQTPIIEVLLNDKLPIEKRRLIMIQEMAAHIWDKLLADKK